uniref:Amine oxidase domain-containing protein n=1 Tax=Chromera velia CCMP2878 TaxID=1169474 RepID=A0A0G4FQD7_9ALVE|eukprot:Cvel_18037.t1-p1 / transcript=Cvel_18037.t1 / gene=Cvel_18037 / organism=Chromera_velia_CCMP2878 / gene_product=Protoporphyrinogen oxidase, chloroplastic, putative / transcript_product=Protoporphyrinogen oxidase, chloroplastic, putative / location=Cvel_scaffold1473:10137-13444(-) / protein_length=613 / sequence_SO=supercontig / SO=protein_coding / is_pseudo=false
MSRAPHVCVIGGGLAGLTTAYTLRRLLPRVRLTILEKADRLGGYIHTHQTRQPVTTAYGNIYGPYAIDLPEPRGRHHVEEGLQFFRMTGRGGSDLLGLIRCLGVEDKVITTAQSRAFFVDYLRLSILWDGMVRKVPSRGDLVRFLPAVLRDLSTKRGEGVDESVESFFRRRTSMSFVDKIIDPICIGSFGVSPSELSARSVFPSLWAAEREGRSLLGGLVRPSSSRKQGGDVEGMYFVPKTDAFHQRVALSGGGIFTFKKGAGFLISSLERGLRAGGRSANESRAPGRSAQEESETVQIRLSTAVAGVRGAKRKKENEKEDQTRAEGQSGAAEVLLESGECLSVDGVVMAVQAPDAVRLLDHPWTRDAWDGRGWESGERTVAVEMGGISHSHTYTVNMGWADSVIPMSLGRTSGVVVPSREWRREGPAQGVLSAHLSSWVFPDYESVFKREARIVVTVRAQSGREWEREKGLFGGQFGCRHEAPEEAAERAQVFAEKVLGIASETEEVWVRQETVPGRLYEDRGKAVLTEGHAEKMKKIHQVRCREIPWMQVVGGDFHGVSASDTVRDARLAAESLARRLRNFPFEGLKEIPEREAEWIQRVPGLTLKDQSEV